MRLVSMLFAVIVGVFANDPAYNRGEMLFFSKGCSSCHGASAEGSSTYPRLANKDESYLIKKLQDFKAGKATTVSQEMMAQFVQKLSEKNIQDLAYFFAHHKKEKEERLDDDLLGGFGS